MKKLVVAKILLISVVPFWMACGKTAVQSELTPTQNNEVKFLTKKAKSADGVKGLVVAREDGVKGITADVAREDGVKGLTEADITAQKVDDGVKGIIDNPDISESIKGSLVDLGADINGLVYYAQDLQDRTNGQAFDDGVKGKIAAFDDGVKGLVEQYLAFADGVKGKLIDADAQATVDQLYDGVKGLTAQADELDNLVEKLSAIPDGVKGKVALVGNVLVLEGEVADQAFKQLILVVDGREKFAVDVNPETMTYSAKFELNKDDMQKMIIDVVIGNEVLTFLVLDGQLQAYNF